MNTESPNQPVQHLINTWHRRPRHQLDFSMLTEESRQDCLWIADVLQALIPSMRVIQEKFDLTPQDTLILNLPPPLAAEGATSHPDDKNGSDHVPEAHGGDKEVPDAFITTPTESGSIGVPHRALPAPSQPAQPQEQGSDDPSKPQEPAQEQAPNIGTPKKRRRKGRSGARKHQKRDKSDKFSSALAKAGVKLVDQSPETSPAPTPPAPVVTTPGPDLSDPPAPKLSEIG